MHDRQALRQYGQPGKGKKGEKVEKERKGLTQRDLVRTGDVPDYQAHM